MIEQLSPFTRKFLAIGILLFALLFGVTAIVLPTATAIQDMLDRLGDSRFELARLEAIDQRKPPVLGEVVDPTLMVTAPSREIAIEQLAALTNSAAATSAVTLERNDPAAPNGNAAVISLDIVAVGPELALSSFLNEVERGRPAIRFARWRIDGEPDPVNGTIRFEGRAVAAWSSGS